MKTGIINMRPNVDQRAGHLSLSHVNNKKISKK